MAARRRATAAARQGGRDRRVAGVCVCARARVRVRICLCACVRARNKEAEAGAERQAFLNPTHLPSVDSEADINGFISEIAVPANSATPLADGVLQVACVCVRARACACVCA